MSSDITILLILALTSLMLVVNGICYVFFWQTTKMKPPSGQKKSSPFSLIICAKNELSALQKNLPLCLASLQNHAELILVDDDSQDGSAEWLAQQAPLFPNLKIVELSPAEKTLPGKKSALIKGIETAQHELLLLCDADCHPIHPRWAEHMIAPLAIYDMVLGLAPLDSRGTLVGHFAALETISTAMQYATWTQLGHPYMGVGRNMAYKKSIFQACQDLDKTAAVASGDDDFIVQAFHKNGRSIVVQSHPESLTLSEAPHTLSAFIRQKSRHISTSLRYPFGVQLGLGVFAGSHLLFYASAICFGILFFWAWAVLFLVIRWLLLLPAWIQWAKIMKAPYSIFHFVLFDIAMLPYYIIMSLKLPLSHKTTWK